MIKSNVIIRTQEMLPEVYSDESRDFQVFTKLMDAVYNQSQFDTSSMLHSYDPANIRSNLLELFADKYGIDLADAETLSDEEIRAIMQGLPYMMRNKGNLSAIESLINIYFKLYHISGDYEIRIENGKAAVYDIELSDHTIMLGLETLSKSTKLLDIISKYILPPGYSFFVYFYTKMSKDTRDIFNDIDATLLYRSSNLDSQIDAQIPDFIFDSLYMWKNTQYFTGDGITKEFALPAETKEILNVRVDTTLINPSEYELSDGRLKFKSQAIAPAKESNIQVQISIKDNQEQIISAIDASQLSTYNTKVKNDCFAGFLTKQFVDNFVIPDADDVPSYDDSAVYQQGDLAKFDDAIKMCVIERPMHITRDSNYDKQYTRWVELKNGVIALVDNIQTKVTDTYMYEETGDIYYYDTTHVNSEHTSPWFKLTFIGSYSAEASQPAVPESNFAYYCKFYIERPILYKQNWENQYTELISKGQVNTDNMSTITVEDEDLYLVYNVHDNTYYYRYNNQWNSCTEGQYISGQITSDYTPVDNTLFWKSGGEYYISYDNEWHKYTEPLFMIKLLQRRDEENE